jgi:hypothetical protein
MAKKTGRVRRTPARGKGSTSKGGGEDQSRLDEDDALDEHDLEEGQRQTWREDKIEDLPEGFTAIDKVGYGTVYYRRADAVVEYGWEFSGVSTLDVLFWDTSSLRWIDVHRLECKPVSPAERKSIKQGLIDFLYARGARFSLDDETYRNPPRGTAAPQKKRRSPHRG